MAETERRKAAEVFKQFDKTITAAFDTWADKQQDYTDCALGDGVSVAIAFAVTVYDSTLAEATGLVCTLCKKGIPVKRMTVEGRYFWHHTGKEWDDNDDCEAGPIHERRAHGKEPKV